MFQLTSVTPKSLMSLAALVLLSAFPVSNALAQVTYCDPKLGRDFDQQKDEVRMARQNIYYDCRLTQDFRFLGTRRKHMLTGIQRWQSRGILVARSTLRTKRHIFDAELKTIYLGERIDFDADFSNRFAKLDAARTPENSTAIDSQRRELTATKRVATAKQYSRQRQEVSLLRETIKQCIFTVSEQIKQLTIADSKYVRKQYLQKSTRLSSDYQTLKKVPGEQSLNEWLANQPITGEAIGRVTDVEGKGTLTNTSGDEVELTPGSLIYLGDVIEMDNSSGCNIVFADRTTMSIGSDSRVEMDVYTYDPLTDEVGERYNILRAVFLFISGLIGLFEVSDVDIQVEFQTHAIGVIGIRG